ncbi:thaumatin-like protein 1 isoform X4 [Zingiber officinale]|uniref:thaumatin-like protein 1 isoform X4 n=1 Tax=Zingiber officinale TaxID=94328 RepID=UPI001C4D19A9|nr:thaumatin-like protein 1 isoform X4 [Zingiber officinale]
MLRFAVLLLLLLVLFLCCCFHGGEGATFTFVNKCGETVWPGILSNAGRPRLQTTGFELASSASRAVAAPGGWSGRFWARTGCSAGGSAGGWSCATGDCGTGRVECDGAGAALPTTLAEFTLASAAAGRDFYDVSLVDGYNLPVLVEASDGQGCPAAGCLVDVGQRCPAELRVAGQSGACRSACDAFGKPEYCCSGAFASSATCRPTVYSQVFKAACPNSYSYAFDDPTSIFTCSGGADYTITFCPLSVPSVKSSRNSSSSPSSTFTTTSSGSSSTSTSRPADGMMLGGDDPWLANLATDDAIPSANSLSFLCHALILAATACVARFLLL